MGTTWSLDYCFMSPEDIEDDMHAILVVYDHSKMGLWTLPVDQKGADEYVVKWLADKMEECGYAGVAVTLKSDQEPSIVDVAREVTRQRESDFGTALEQSAVGESDSNATVERAIQASRARSGP